MGRLAIMFTWLLALVLAVPAAIAVTGGLSAEQTSSATATKPPNLVANGNFSAGLMGWEVDKPGRQHLGTALLVEDGESVASLSGLPPRRATTAAWTTQVEMSSNDGKVQTTAGQLYAVVADVRASGQAVRGELRVRESNGDGRLGRGVSAYAIEPDGWTTISLMYVARTSGAKLRISIRGDDISGGSRLLVDNVALVAVGAVQ